MASILDFPRGSVYVLTITEPQHVRRSKNGPDGLKV
jgi:hypothetical protein